MRRIGLLSDTHGFWDDRYAEYLSACDEIWHAGDIGSMEVAERLAGIRPLRAVWGNCDGADLRRVFPEKLCWNCEDTLVLMKHIGGGPPNYGPGIRRQVFARPPALFISGHSHILRVERDSRLGLLHINPGAAGLQGWQTVRTLVRFSVDGARVGDLEVVEIPRPGASLRGRVP